MPPLVGEAVEGSVPGVLCDGHLWFYYDDIKEEAAHYLDLSEWGVTQSWVILWAGRDRR